MKFRAPFVGLAALGLVACGSGNDAPALDGGSDSGGLDAAADTAIPDGGGADAAGDAGSDAGGDADAGAPVWSHRGLDNNAFYSLVVDPKNPLTLFAGTSASGLFRTKDGGVTWAPINTGLPSATQAIHAIAFDPSTAGHVFVSIPGIGLGGLYVSTNGGDTWTNVATMPVGTPESIVVDPGAPAHMWTVGSTEGVYASTDSGVSWAKTANTGLPLTTSALNVLGLDPKTGTLFCGVDSLVLMKSADKGATWTPASTGLAADAGASGTVLSVAALTSGTLFAQTSGSGLFKSVDTGTTWTAVSTTPVTRYHGLATDPHDPTVLYVSSDNAGLFRSSDSGGTFKLGGPPGQSIVDVVAVASDGTLYVTTGGGGGVWSRPASTIWP